jgi:Uma2 family endonuclease
LVTRKHSQVQTNIIYLIRRLYGKTLLPLPELTTHIKETTFFLPDVAIEERSRPRQGRYPGPDDPVFLCVEVVSPPDRVGKLFGKCEEYHRWGVSYCWVIDPERKLAWEYFSADIEPRKVDGHLIKAGLIELALDDVFEDV